MRERPKILYPGPVGRSAGPRRARLRRLAPFLVAWLLVAAGCGTAPVRVFMHPQADLSYYAKVGVVPFRSIAADRFAGEKFTAEFMTALLSSQLFEVTDYGIFLAQVAKVLGSKSPAEGITPEDLKRVGEAAGVQGVFVGTVSEYQMTPSASGTFPVISVEVRLLDVETSNVVWMATATERGGPKTPIVGIGEIHTLGGLSQKMSRGLVGKLK